MKRDLSRLLNPKSIALFGGSWAENVIVQLQKSDFPGEIWPVHPTRESICGVPCIQDISKLPSAPDASFIGVNRELTIEIIAELTNMGAGGATCFASGFLESVTEDAGAADLQTRLVEAAGEMPILGPNCYGLLNYLEGVTLWPDQHGGRSVNKGVAIIGQSSNVLINMTMQKRGLPISHVVAAGNQAQTSHSDIAEHLLGDPRVTAIGLYIEGFGDIRKLESMASKARDLGKPIVAIKTGKSEKSRLATLTHTASLAGGAVASSTLMKRLGIIEVQSVAVFLETLKLLHICGPLAGNAISSMSCSGGEAGLIADMVEGTSIEFRGFSEKQYRSIKQVLGSLVTVANPLDYHTFIWNDEEKLAACYRSVLQDNFDLNILIMDLPHDTRCDASAWDAALRAIKQAKQDTSANVALLATLPENLTEKLNDELIQHGIVPLHGMEEMVQAVDAAIRAGSVHETAPDAIMISPSSSSEVQVVDALNEAQSKTELSKFGLNFPKNATVKSPAGITEALDSLTFPVVLKGLGIAHKSEAGAIILNLHTPDATLNAATEMRDVTEFLIEEMVTAPIAELLIGVTRDTTGMLLMTVGAGGVLTELLGDTASLLIPSTREEIAASLSELKLASLLRGYRGNPAADIDAILDAIIAVQAYCIANPQLTELDINPLLALKDGAVAVDALIVQRT